MSREERLVRSAVQSMLGNAQDNAARARAAFKNHTPAQMQEQHGESGRTRAEILYVYEEHLLDCEHAMQWFNDLTKGESKTGGHKYHDMHMLSCNTTKTGNDKDCNCHDWQNA